jgi:multimeric flavodoxin WrbA
MHLIITASPNTDGLTAACGNALLEGYKEKGEAELIDISALKLEPCRICGNGWGTCFAQAECVIKDGVFKDLQKKIRACDGFALVTPVYWSQPSERMKYFLDRFRRCEAFNKAGSAAAGKPVILVAAAGGSGHGTAQTLSEMEMWCRHVGAKPTDYIGVTRFNREMMLEVIRQAGERKG